MNWIKHGIIWNPSGEVELAKSHAMIPTPFMLNSSVIRIIVTCLDSVGIGRPFFIDVDSQNPKNILKVGKRPLLDIGREGTFDENGVLVTSVIKQNESEYLLYYAGFELGKKIPYRLLTGLASSNDGGETFKRIQETPILERKEGELYFRGGAFVYKTGNLYKMLYVGGEKWEFLNGRSKPVYEIKETFSFDGISWNNDSKLLLPISNPDEHGFGRPWLFRDHSMQEEIFYSIRKKTKIDYELGYGIYNKMGIIERNDSGIGLDQELMTFENKAQMYMAVISTGGRTFAFYNGNSFGIDGIAFAERI